MRILISDFDDDDDDNDEGGNAVKETSGLFNIAGESSKTNDPFQEFMQQRDDMKIIDSASFGGTAKKILFNQ